jgi:glycosyltransferase involved in cell wall biosynthesis
MPGRHTPSNWDELSEAWQLGLDLSAAIALVTWANEEPTGGNVYNRKLVAALRARGKPVEIVKVPGTWPTPDATARSSLAAVLAERPISLVDGIVAGAAPEAIRAATRANRTVVILVHLPIGADQPSRPEEQALRAASAVICTSQHCADLLEVRYELDRPAVALPGADLAPVAVGSRPPRLIMIAALTPNKDQLTVVGALDMISDLAWSAALVGSTTVDRDYAKHVRTMIDSAGLAKRIMITGALTGVALEGQWATADLVLLVSRVEMYGLVVTEALAHGLPVVVGAGTGAEEALAASRPADASLPGLAVPVGRPVALASALRRWMSDPELRTAWRTAALHRRETLAGWDQTATAVLDCLVEFGSR